MSVSVCFGYAGQPPLHPLIIIFLLLWLYCNFLIVYISREIIRVLLDVQRNITCEITLTVVLTLYIIYKILTF